MNPGSCPSKKSGPHPRKTTLQRVLLSLGSLEKGKKQPMERTPKWRVGWGGAGNPCQRCRLRAKRLSSTVRGWEPARGSGREQEESHCGENTVWPKSRTTREVEGWGGECLPWRIWALKGTFQYCMKGVRKFGGGERVGRICNQTMELQNAELRWGKRPLELIQMAFLDGWHPRPRRVGIVLHRGCSSAHTGMRAWALG